MLLIANLRQVATPNGTASLAGNEQGALAVIDDAFVLIDGERITAVGRMAELRDALPDPGAGFALIDGSGMVALPGFVDAHTHLPFAGFRDEEFRRRLKGATYQEIAAAGGGIHSTVAATRAASLAELIELSTARADSFLLYGTTTIEAKSGYGLNLADEIKQLETLAYLAKHHPLGVIPTLLAAHEVPVEYRESRQAYLDLVCDVIVPEVGKRGLARYCDVFCETGVFSVAESRRVLESARAHGMKARLHADELSPLGGAELAAEIGAASADHLMCVTAAGIAAMAQAGVVAVLLPGTSFFLKSAQKAPARRLIDAGVPVALATDFNPGSSYCESIPAILALACLTLAMSIEESLVAATLNAAASLGLAGEIGSLEPGKRADVILCEVPNYSHLVYHYGVNPVATVIKDGRIVVRDRRRTDERRRNGDA